MGSCERLYAYVTVAYGSVGLASAAGRFCQAVALALPFGHQLVSNSETIQRFVAAQLPMAGKCMQLRGACLLVRRPGPGRDPSSGQNGQMVRSGTWTRTRTNSSKGCWAANYPMPEGAQAYRIKFPDDDTTIPAKPSAPWRTKPCRVSNEVQ